MSTTDRMTEGLDYDPREGERAVLGGVLRWPTGIADVAELLRPQDFARDNHGLIWRAILALWDDGKPVDLRSVADELHRQGHVANIGGYEYLAALWDETPTGANAVYHATRVRERAIIRSLHYAGSEIAASADLEKPTGSPDQLLEQAEQLVFGIAQMGASGQAVPLAEAVTETADVIDRRHKEHRNLSGLSTGYLDLDTLTCGLQEGELVVVAARPSVGKTAFALNLMRHPLANGCPVFFASLEQRRTEVAERLLVREARVDGQHVRLGLCTSEELARMAAAVDVVRPWPLFIDDAGSQTVTRIAATARRLKLKHGLALVAVDYLGLVQPGNLRDPRHEQIGQIARRLKQLARDLNTPVVLLAQLNREVEHRGGKPRLADLRDSGEVEQHADVVMMLHRQENKQPHEPDVECLIRKQRNGPLGDVPFTFLRPCMRFENFAPEPFA